FSKIRAMFLPFSTSWGMPAFFSALSLAATSRKWVISAGVKSRSFRKCFCISNALSFFQKGVYKLHLLGGAGHAGAAVAVALADAGMKVDGLVDVSLEQGVRRLQFRKRQLLQGLPGGGAGIDQLPHGLVGVPEGHALLGEVVGAVG